MAKTYRAELKCKNCSMTQWFDCEEGKLAKEYADFEGMRCTYCKCFLVQGKEEKEKE